MKKILITILILCLFCSLGFAQAHKGGAHKVGGLIGLQNGAAQGDIVYLNGADWVVLNIGSNGFFLTSNGTIPSWGSVSVDSSWTSASIDTLTSHLFSNATSGTVNHLLEDTLRAPAIGIGIEPAGGLLHVFEGASGIGSYTGTAEIVLESDGLVTMDIITADGQLAGFQFGVGANATASVAYDDRGGGNPTDQLLLTTAINGSSAKLDPYDAGAGEAIIGEPGDGDWLTVNGRIDQEIYVIRKHVALSGATDNVATNIFTITTTDETGSADGGMYSVHVHLTVGEATAASGAVNTASVGLGVRWTRIMASAGTGANSAVVEIGETASADEGTGAISLVTVTVTETSEFVQQVLVVANTSGGTFDAFAIVELVYSDFTTAPVIN